MEREKLVVTKVVKILFFFMILWLSLPNAVEAENEDSLGFSYENIIPKNQISKKTFFELKVEPGQKQTLVTKVSNLTDKEKVIQIVISDATTSPSGVINYGASKEKLIGKKPLSIKDMLKGPNQVKLKPNETKEIKFDLEVPKKEFDGMVLGGIQLKEVEKNKEVKIKETASLKNEYSYVYSISLIENDKKLKPDFTSSGALFNKMAYVNVNNIESMIVSNISVSTVVMTEKSDQVINEFKVDNYRMAPNSALILPLEGTEELANGKYRTETKVKVDGKEWSFDGEFEVTKETKAGTDTLFEDTTGDKKMNWLVVVLVIVSFLSTVAAIFFFLDRRFVKKKRKVRK